MKKDNVIKMIDLYVLSHVPVEGELSESEGTPIIKEILDSELDDLYSGAHYRSMINPDEKVEYHPVTRERV